MKWQVHEGIVPFSLRGAHSKAWVEPVVMLIVSYCTHPASHRISNVLKHIRSYDVFSFWSQQRQNQNSSIKIVHPTKYTVPGDEKSLPYSYTDLIYFLKMD